MIFILAAVVAAGLFLYVQSIPVDSPMDISIPVPKSDANQKKQYKDAESGISFEYNPAWTVSKTRGSVADTIVVAVDQSSVVSISIYHDKKTIDSRVQSALAGSCTYCRFQKPVTSTLPNGSNAVEVYAYDTNNKVDMRPGTFYFGNDAQQFSIKGEGVNGGTAVLSILNTLDF